mmetsp:Transcript_57852/g.179767  ORF Transcript_57852/g.179767 Transcript_57852/m.179767 type:complete len:276 (+) Transcript_57852:1205-2032(+)
MQVPRELLHRAPLVALGLHVAVRQGHDQVVADEGWHRDGGLGAEVVGQGLDVALHVLADAVRQPEVDLRAEAQRHRVVGLRVVGDRRGVEDVDVAPRDLGEADEHAGLVEVPEGVQGPVVDEAPAVRHLQELPLHVGEVEVAEDRVGVNDGEHDLEGGHALLLHVDAVDLAHGVVLIGVLADALARRQHVLGHDELLDRIPAEPPQRPARLVPLGVTRLGSDDEHRPPRQVRLPGDGRHRAREDLEGLLVLHDDADVEQRLRTFRGRRGRHESLP